jgi:transcriptional regulator with XRE-family HTH domain
MAKTSKPSVNEILRKYQQEQGCETDAAFAEALGIDRQRLSQWMTETHQPSVDVLKVWAMLYIITTPWKARMAVELLKAMGLEEEIPCTCLELVGDNEYCPKHEGVVV